MSGLSVIIPTLNEEKRLPALLAGLQRAAPPLEIIVVDGGSRDRTVDVARAAGAVVYSSAAGRGRQLAIGAARAGGDVLLFLHADTQVPPGAISALTRRLAAETVLVGGNFRLLFDGHDGFSRWLDGFYALLRRKTIFYGDSGIFIRRRTLDRIGGVRPLALMEDFDLVRRMKRAGPLCCIDEPPLLTSSRRFQGRHPINIVFGWLWIHLLFSLGLGSDRLASIYDSARRRRPDPIHRSTPSHRHSRTP